METVRSSRYFNILSLVFGTWFLLTSWMWVYYVNLFVSIPIGLAGLFFWYRARRLNGPTALNKAALALHALAVVSCLLTLVLLL